MKKFVQWWIKGTGFGGNIKFCFSIVMLILVVIFQSTQTYHSQNSNEVYYDDYTYEDYFEDDYENCDDNSFDVC